MKMRAFIADLLFVLLFVAIGRHAHKDGSSLGGMASTAWPFAVGLLSGWIFIVLTHRTAAELLQISPTEVLERIKSRDLGFIAGPSGIAITTHHISCYLLGKAPRATPEHRPQTMIKKARNRYVKARTRR